MRNLTAAVFLGIAVVVQAQEALAQDTQQQAPLRTQGQIPVPGREAPEQSRGQVPVPPEARQPQRIVLVDRIVAVVGKEVVTASELSDQRVQAERQLRAQGTPLPEPGILERQILDRLILDKAQLALAKENGIRVEEIQLDRAMERIAENNKMTLSAFRQALEKDGIPYAKFREEVSQQIQMQRLREREVDERIDVSDIEVDQFLESTRSNSGARSEFNLSHVLVRLPDQASPEQIDQAHKKAEKARAEAASGIDFAKIAASYSDAPDAMQGGSMGWRNEDRLPEIFTAALKSLRPGETSPVLRSPGGFHVIKLMQRRGSDEGAAVMQTHARHILIRTGELTSEAEARRRLTDLRQRVVNGGADFAELARANSADGSAARGGDLDWLLPGDTVPEFERVMNALKNGEISQPFATSFGWHVVQVLERREAGVTQDRKRMQARQALKERKSDEAYQDWLRQLRDKTYVEMRLEDK